MQTMTTRQFLAGYDDSTRDQASNMKMLGIRQRVFGELARRAAPLIKYYHSDLYHDVHWLDNHLNGPMTFYFGADDCGTAIGEDAGLVAFSRKHVWRVELTHEKGYGRWYLTMTEVTE